MSAAVAIVREQMKPNGVPPSGQHDAQVSAAEAQALAPAMRGLLRHDPRPALARTRVPALALTGERDVQVDADQNLPAIREALADAGNGDVVSAGTNTPTPLWRLVVRAPFFMARYGVLLGWPGLIVVLDQAFTFGAKRRCLNDLICGTEVVRRDGLRITA